MFCPKCSHRQTPEHGRFCSRCGFQLSAIAEIISNVEKLKNLTGESERAFSRLKQPSYQIGAKLIFSSLTLLPVVFILSYIFDSPVPFVIPLLILFTGFAKLIYARLFDEAISMNGEASNLRESLAKQPLRLPPADAVIRNTSFNALNTKEIISRPSVTEHTTKLLEINNESSDSDV